MPTRKALFSGVSQQSHKRKKAVTVWYVQTFDSRANEFVGKHLDCDESAASSVFCSDGKKRNMWQCRSYNDVATISQSAISLDLFVKIWVRQGNGSAHPCPFSTLPRPKRPKVKRKVNKSQRCLF